MIEIEFDTQTLLNEPHREIFHDDSRFTVAACGRRFGKTYLAAYRMLLAAYGSPGIYFYLAPNLSQAREIFWDILKEKAINELIEKTNETRLEITFVNGSRIALKSAERPDSLRGVSLSGIVLDEVASFRDFLTTWQKVIRPALSDKQGWALFISSPSGRNHFYDLFQNGKTLPGWSSHQFTTIDGGYVPDEEIEAARADLDPTTFRQEYMATFESYSGLVVPHFDRSTHLVHDFELLPNEPLLVGIDLNVQKMPAVICVLREGTIIAFREFYGDLDTPALIKTLKSAFPGRHMTIYPDSSSGQRSTVGADRTSLKLFEENFDRVRTKRKNPRILDRINAFNAMVMSGSGLVRFKVTPQCNRLVESLEKHSYDKTGLPDKHNDLDHMFDAVSYLTYWHSPLTKTVTRVSGFRL